MVPVPRAGLGILAYAAVAQETGAPLAVGLTAAAMLALSWTQLRVGVAQAQQPAGAGS